MLIRKKFTTAGPVYYRHVKPAIGGPYVMPDLSQASDPITFTTQGIPFKGVFQGGRTLFVEGDYPDDADFLKYLLEANKEDHPAYEARLNLLSETANRILEIVKYILGNDALHESLKMQQFISQVFLDNEWVTCYDKFHLEYVKSTELDRLAVSRIQSLLDGGIQSLHTIKFVARAKVEQHPGDKLLLLALAAKESPQVTMEEANQQIEEVEQALINSFLGAL